MEAVLEVSLFEAVADALRGMLDPSLGPFQTRWHKYGIKLWFGERTSSPEHYEAQIVGARLVPEATVLALEIGFHAEHRAADQNAATLAHLLEHERRWRRALGNEAVADVFLGRRDDWRRLSEAWPDPDLSGGDCAFEIADRLVEYAQALEPVLRRR